MVYFCDVGLPYAWDALTPPSARSAHCMDRKPGSPQTSKAMRGSRMARPGSSTDLAAAMEAPALAADGYYSAGTQTLGRVGGE